MKLVEAYFGTFFKGHQTFSCIIINECGPMLRSLLSLLNHKFSFLFACSRFGEFQFIACGPLHDTKFSRATTYIGHTLAPKLMQWDLDKLCILFCQLKHKSYPSHVYIGNRDDIQNVSIDRYVSIHSYDDIFR